jgi:hypothetical protein
MDMSGPMEEGTPGDIRWQGIERQLREEAAFREALAGSGDGLRADAVALLAHLQAVRDRLDALRAAAEDVSRLAGKALSLRGSSE